MTVLKSFLNEIYPHLLYLPYIQAVPLPQASIARWVEVGGGVSVIVLEHDVPN